jgi:phosphoglycerate kinase
MQAELKALARALGSPRHPVAAIVGGAKVSTKLELLGNLVRKVDLLIIGGGMANTFLHADGVEIGTSLAERDLADTARAIRATAEREGCRVLLQSDAVVADRLAPGVAAQTVAIGAVPPDAMILDAGPASVGAFVQAIEGCRTLVWNGPVGAFETPPFDRGTAALAVAVARLSDAGSLMSVAGGGDTVAALAAAGVVDRLGYVSTAGGAFLEWLEGKTLPGVSALEVG